jgi:enolase
MTMFIERRRNTNNTMAIIKEIRAREILDSRGNPTVEAEIFLEDGTMGRAEVPSGASTGAHEASELRDGDPKRFGGRGVLKAVQNVNGEIKAALVGHDASDQNAVDQALIALDGTESKRRLGANAILSVSLAVARAAAASRNMPLYEYVHGLSRSPKDVCMPLPLCNVVNGGKHATGSTDIQEFMIVPVGFTTFREALRALAETFQSLKDVLGTKGYSTTVGDEGGFAPRVTGGNVEALDLISEAIRKAGYELGKDIRFALDAASSEFYADGKYNLAREGKTFSSEEMIAWYGNLAAKYPISSIEDALAQDDWDGWQKMAEKMGATTQLVGDDLFVTNVKFLARGIRDMSANAVIIKPNQIGTLTETIEAIDMAHEAGWKAIVSHRSGETEDVFIAHLAVGLGTGQVKIGSVSRGERTAKYNELLRIEERLGNQSAFPGGSAFR